MRLKRSARNGLIYCLVFAIVAGWLADDYFKNIETRAYDLHMRNSEILTHPDIVIISIDNKSIDKIGAWPWSRDLLGKVINDLSKVKPSLIATTEVMSHIQKDMGRLSLEALQEKINSLEPGPSLDVLQKELDSALKITQTDEVLADSIANARNVMLPIILHPTASLTEDDEVSIYTKEKFALKNQTTSSIRKNKQLYKINTPNYLLNESIEVLGHINKSPDNDGVIRRERLLWPVDNYLVPSLSLRIYLQHTKNLEALNLHSDIFKPSSVTNKGSEQVIFQDIEVNIPANGVIYSRFYSEQRKLTFKNFSFYDVFSEQIPLQEFENKIVLIGPTAAGIGSQIKVSSGQTLAPIENLAHVSSSLLNNDWIHRGKSQRITETVLYLILAIYIVFIAPKKQIITNAIITVSVSFALLVFQFGSLEFSYWYKFLTPIFFLLFGMATLGFVTLRLKDSAQIKNSQEREHVNLQLGLAFQQQGALDLALEKFLECKKETKLLSPLYNLALEYERKRQYAKSLAVYEYMENIDPQYLDIEKRIIQSKNLALSSTQQMFGEGSRLTSLLNNDSLMEKPRLGRYELESEIGRGAMSIVYAGRDPSINRVVAIKVQSFVGDNEKQLGKMRERFLTEAKTAGHLSHPDIITIYDIGEEVDLIYIAMEYLSGKSLDDCLKEDKLSDATIFEISLRMAKALSYAHGKKVIHRDIKPSNIIYDQESGKVYLTDFGIARMQDTHLTQTGQVVGTPSYMSPEQITGKRVDHRSDLFSLGSTMYQLFSGALPFQADTMATLLYKITMEAHTPLKVYRDDLPVEIVSIIDKLLKEPDERFQTAEALANALEDCKNVMNNNS